MPDAKDLLQVYSHVQRDIESVKQRQWRDFNATLLGQGGILFLSQQLDKTNALWFVSASALLLSAGIWFLIENREVLKVYRAVKNACSKKLKATDEELYKVLDPPDVPIITGKLHHLIYLTALFLVSVLVIAIILGCPLSSQCFFNTLFFMAIGVGTLSHLVPILIKG